jgi:5-formyltetrahydrofolate cyclo-ligase
MSKEELRRHIRARLRASNALRFPDGGRGVPNFAGVEQATDLLRTLRIWKQARSVYIALAPSTLLLRRAALEEGKTVYTTLPGLRDKRCFLELSRERLGPLYRRAATRCGAVRYGTRVTPLEADVLDLFIYGAVAVALDGGRLGGGGGWEDLSYALFRAARRVVDFTPVVALVHNEQLLREKIPMALHDVPTDVIITPTNVFSTITVYSRPTGILWKLVTEAQRRLIPALDPNWMMPPAVHGPYSR